MAQPKLFETLSVLTAEEWVSFKKFLLMYLRKESDNFKCYELLRKHRDKILAVDFDEKLRAKHFPKVSPKAFSNMLSVLFNWFEEWFAIETFKNRPYENQLMLVKGYNQKGLFKLADKHFKSLETKIAAELYINAEQQPALSRLYNYQYFSNNPIKKDKSRSFLKESLNRYLESVTEQTLAYLLEVENSAKGSKVDYSDGLALLYEITAASIDSKIIMVLKLAIKMIKDDDLQSFLALNKYLKLELIDTASDLHLVLTMYLRRSATFLWHKGVLQFSQPLVESFHLSFKALEKNKHQKFLATSLFNAVEAIGIVESYEDTEAFINQWIAKVHTKDKGSVLRYANALNAFRHEKYDQLPALLNGLEFDDVANKMISNSLMIIAHYKLGEDQLVVTFTQNFKKQLKRNKSAIISFIFNGLNNLVDIILLLQKSKYDHNIKINLDEISPIFYKSWVLKELKNERR